MKIAAIALVGTMFAVGGAFAQQAVEPPTASDDRTIKQDFNVDNVDAASPWGTMVVDMTRAPNAGEYTDDQMAELEARCEVIEDNPSIYGAVSGEYCNTRLGKTNK